LLGVTSFDAVTAGAPLSDCSETRLLLVALESRREDLYVQFFDPHGDPLREPAAIMPFMLAEVVATTVGERPLLIAGDAAQRASAALAQCPDIAVLAASAPGAVGALRAGLRQLRLGIAADAPRPLYLRPPNVTLPEG
jgi:tRNA threonylcarbamoyladenosine biosynthesis protein TsaB